MSANGGQTYGQHLPDQVERISALSDAQLELLADVRELHKERAALEREYAAKLQLLAKKAADKKAKKIIALVVGSEPTKAWDESTPTKSTLDKAYTQLISSITESSQDHVYLADALTSQVVEPLKMTERKYEDSKKREAQHYQKLLAERDRIYADRIRNKQKYDEECAEVETYRQKQERSADDRHAERAARQYEQQQADMLNSKNAYLISITVANKVKDKFYAEDLPSLEDELQDLQTRLLTRFVGILKGAQDIQLKHLDALRAHLTDTETALNAVSPQADQDLFIDYNIAPFTPPPDWGFEPSPVHYDHGDMSVEPTPKVYLQNRLSRCKAKLLELDPVLASKRREAEQLEKLVAAYTSDETLGNAGEVLDNYLDARHEVTFYGISRAVLSTESETISSALNGDEGAQSPHSFKSSSFSIPTTCAYCKLPADCTGTRQGGRGHGLSDSVSSISSVSRSSSVISHGDAIDSSALATPTPSSFARTSHVVEDKGPSARVLFDFSPTSPFELTASGASPGYSDGVFMSARLTITYFLAESIVHVLEEDDGSGWVKVADDSGATGLVPASYLEFLDAAPTPDSRASTPGPGAPVSTDDCGTDPCISRLLICSPISVVRGIYPYKAQGPDELDVEEGTVIRLTDGPSGGRNYADGWWEGTRVCWPYSTYSEADGPLDPGFRGGREWEERHLPQQLRKSVIYTFSGRSCSLFRCRWRPHRFGLGFGVGSLPTAEDSTSGH
ncbi:Protein BZZ1 [Trametes pubescens]|uniref:Protein BZZ1 n=1 Tax=Trametes pubescens TaxID=154538 RepID=A0A1M2VKH2_TRAPU|nr:Protein BZZ1 [Trametes pubescens]